MTRAASSLDPDGPVAASIADLWWLMLILGTIVFLLFLGLLAAGLWRRGETDVDEDHQHPVESPPDERRLVRRWVVLGGVAMPAVVILVVLGATLRSMVQIPWTADEDTMVIEVVGRQWWWEVRYPEAGVTVANELHLPTGRTVSVQVTSADVIHSLWIPPLAGKIDALPDGVNTLVLKADEPGTYRTQCAEFCGLQHAQMKMLVVAEPPDDFAAWLADPSRAGDAGEPTAPPVVTPSPAQP